jgi:Flp pilus assembly pilin Flp
MSENVRRMSEILPQISAPPSIEVDDTDFRPLNNAVKLFVRLLADESGATAVEYSLILGGIAAAIIVMMYVFGDKVNNLYSNTQSQWP